MVKQLYLQKSFFYVTAFLGISFWLSMPAVYAQDTNAVLDSVISKLELVKTQKTHLHDYTIIPLKDELTGADLDELLQMEQLLTDETITAWIRKDFREKFTEKEIDRIYALLLDNTLEKLVAYLFDNTQENSFQQVYRRLDELETKAMQRVIPDDYQPRVFTPISTTLVDGFYEASGEVSTRDIEKITWFSEPSITLSAIEKVTKEEMPGGFAISIVLNKDGAAKFSRMTRQNLARPIALVVHGEIIAAPFVNEPIDSGQLTIGGALSEASVDVIVARLKK